MNIKTSLLFCLNRNVANVTLINLETKVKKIYIFNDFVYY